MPKRVLQGVVVSDKNDKTVVVRVERRFTHPLLQKTVRRSKNYHAHDEKNQFKVGEMVWIEECPPISKQKRWVVLSREQAAGNNWPQIVMIRRTLPPRFPAGPSTRPWA